MTVDWAEAFTKYHCRIAAYVYRRTNDYFLAEDIACDVFTKAIEAEQSGQGARTSFSGWLYRIAHNLVIDHYRNRSRQQTDSIDDMLYLPDHKGDPVKTAEQLCDREQIDRVLEKLPQSQATVLYLRFFEGYSFAEIGQYIGKTEQAAKMLFLRGERSANFLLKNKDRQQVKKSWVVIQDLLLEHGPLSIEEMMEFCSESHTRIVGALRWHDSLFIQVGTKPSKTMRRKAVLAWGLAGIHDQQKEAA